MHGETFTEDALREVVSTYEAARNAAQRARDEAIRQFAKAGWPASDLHRVTGYSRETIRQILNPQIREEINAGRREVAALRLRDGRRPWVVPGSLEELRGPTTGVVTLPTHLGGDADATYDLDWSGAIPMLYDTVLITTESVEDLRTLVNGELLVRAWPQLVLPPNLRRLWNKRFPVLSRRLSLDPWPDKRLRARKS